MQNCYIIFNILLFISVSLFPSLSFAGYESDLQVPRFVSLSTDKAYARTGPGKNYPVRWVYVKEHMPLKVIQDYYGWRKVTDIDGHGGWMHRSLLSGKRRVMINIKNYSENDTDSNFLVNLFKEPSRDSELLLRLENKVIADLEECKTGWCKIIVAGNTGWVEGKFLWGIYGDKELY